MSVALVNGASGGIGTQFVRHLLRGTQLAVVATSRKGADAKSELLKDGLDKHSDRLTCLEMDVTKEDSIAEAAKSFQNKHGKGSLRLMLNLPGIVSGNLSLYTNALHTHTANHPLCDHHHHAQLEAEKSLAHIQQDRLERVFAVNTFGHLLSYKHFTPMLPSKSQLFDGSQKDPAAPYVPSDLSVLASLSARVGSIGENERGGWYSYRASKAALNQIIKTLNIEMGMRATAPTIALALHPWVCPSMQLACGHLIS